MGVREDIRLDSMYYSGFLKNNKMILNLEDDAECLFTVDLIYLRYSLAMNVLTSLNNSFTLVRKRVLNTEVDVASVKMIIDRILPVGAMLHRLVKGEHLVWPGLNTCNRIFELNHKTLRALYLLFRMNFASILIIKSMAGLLTPEKIVFLVQLSKYAAENSKESIKFWESAHENNVQKELLLHSKMSLNFFKIVSYYAIIRCNLFEKDGLMVKKKNYNQIVWENYLLSDAIKNLTNEVQGMPIEPSMGICFKENQMFLPDFVSFYMNYYTEEAIKSYGYLKDQMDNQLMSSAEEILEYVACTSDFITKVYDKFS